MSRLFPFVLLASLSPRRHELLLQLGVPHRVLPPLDAPAAEALEAQHVREAPAAYVRRVTGLKLERALRDLPSRGLALAPVLCADTTVALGRDILGKPQDASQAGAMLRQLSGREHRVLTAVAIGWQQQRLRALSISRVRFAELDQRDVTAYVASGEWQGKAGGYAIQGLAARFIAHISGSYSGIMGLPLFETAALLRQLEGAVTRA